MRSFRRQCPTWLPAAAHRTFLKGQGATEYLVLLAVVLIIALVAIALLGFFPGMASDAKATQSKAYWQSASPIGVVEGIGHMNTNYYQESSNAVVITLQNNGGETIELLGIGYPNEPSDISVDCNVNDPQDRYCHIQYFSPDYGVLAGDGAYSAYIAPPKGDGWKGTNDPYTSKIFIAPGEKISVGLFARTGYPPSKRSFCYDYLTGQSSKSMELDSPTFYYAVKVDGIRLIKRQVGSKPLVIPCSSDTPPF